MRVIFRQPQLNRRRSADLDCSEAPAAAREPIATSAPSARRACRAATSRIGVDMSASLNRIWWPCAARTPARTAAPLPRLTPGSSTITFRSPRLRTSCGVSSVEPSSDTTISKSVVTSIIRAAIEMMVGTMRSASLYAGTTIESSGESEAGSVVQRWNVVSVMTQPSAGWVEPAIPARSRSVQIRSALRRQPASARRSTLRTRQFPSLSTRMTSDRSVVDAGVPPSASASGTSLADRSTMICPSRL